MTVTRLLGAQHWVVQRGRSPSLSHSQDEHHHCADGWRTDPATAAWLSPATLAQRLGTLRMFFVRLHEWDWSDAPPPGPDHSR
jgi:hypothetical protein